MTISCLLPKKEEIEEGIEVKGLWMKRSGLTWTPGMESAVKEKSIYMLPAGEYALLPSCRPHRGCGDASRGTSGLPLWERILSGGADMSMRYWKVTLGVYSPTFIGSGTTYRKEQVISMTESIIKCTFWMKEKSAIFLGQHGLIDDFAQALARELSRFDLFFYVRNRPQLRRTYGSVWNVIHAMQEDGVIRAEEEYYAADRNGRLNDIAGFIRDAEGNPYVPGSSLKGAFRTAILTSEIRKNRRLYQSDWMNLKQAAGGGGWGVPWTLLRKSSPSP